MKDCKVFNNMQCTDCNKCVDFPYSSLSLNEVIKNQTKFQELIVGKPNVGDNIKQFMYHITALNEEVGEVLQEDKRWKTHRNTHYNPQKKAEELADVFITVLNLIIFSGSSDKIEDIINKKIKENYERWSNK